MRRMITYSHQVTYSLDYVIAHLRENHSDLSDADLEREARETIKEWAEEELNVSADYLCVTEEDHDPTPIKELEY